MHRAAATALVITVVMLLAITLYRIHRAAWFPVHPSAVQGELYVAGSGAVFPLTEYVIESLRWQDYDGIIRNDAIGSRAGFWRLCIAAESDIAAANRPILPDEQVACREIGRHPVGFTVGMDAIAVVTHPQNTFATDLTLEELGQIFAGAQTWQDVRPSWPDREITRVAPGTGSATFDYFIEAVYGDDATAVFDHIATLPITAVDCMACQLSDDPDAIGYINYAYYQHNRSRLNLVTLNGVNPTAATISAGRYPLARPLMLYTDAQTVRDKPQVAFFLEYYLRNVSRSSAYVGYFPPRVTTRWDNLRAADRLIAPDSPVPWLTGVTTALLLLSALRITTRRLQNLHNS